MQVRVKLLTGQTREISVEDGATIATLKDALADEYVRESLKFILRGAILSSDEKALSELQMSDSDTLILIGKKRAVELSKKIPQQATMASAYKSLRNVGQGAKPVTSTQAVASPIAEDVVNNIVGMGFDRDMVLEALKKAKYNADLAVEYCLNGSLPEASSDMAEASSMEEEDDEIAEHEIIEPSMEDLHHLQNLLTGHNTSERGETELCQKLRTFLNFDRIRKMVLDNTSMLFVLIDFLVEAYPDIHRLLKQNPEEFMEYIENGLPEEPEITMRVDPSAIQRLMNIGGFSQEEATRAYILANRNEDIAASILFEALEQQTMGDGNL